MKGQLKAICDAISDDNIDIVKRETHSIKGGASNMNANDLSRVAAKLENLSRKGSLEGSNELFMELEEEFHRLKSFIKSKKS